MIEHSDGKRLPRSFPRTSFSTHGILIALSTLHRDIYNKPNGKRQSESVSIAGHVRMEMYAWTYDAALCTTKASLLTLQLILVHHPTTTASVSHPP